MIYAPSVTFAQKRDNSNSENNRPIAANSTNDMNGLDLRPVSKVVIKDSLITKKAVIDGLKQRNHLEKGDKYVPLAGELKYFGKNNELVLNYTKNYFEKNIRHFSTIKMRSNKYFGIIDNTFERRDVPKELKYLSVIESGLNNTATSPVGAAGPWQFMQSTAQFMGLTVSGKRDDRRDWHKSTNAAAKYLNYLYDQFQDWLLVVAAYNSGPRPVINAINKTGKSDFFAIKKYLPAETQNHVMAFIATATIMERMDDYIGNPLPKSFRWQDLNVNGGENSHSKLVVEAGNEKKLKLNFSTEELNNMAIVRIKKPIDLDILASNLGIDRKLVGRWNFEYYSFIDNQLNGSTEDYKLRIPKDKLEDFLNKKDQLEKQTARMEY